MYTTEYGCSTPRGSCGLDVTSSNRYSRHSADNPAIKGLHQPELRDLPSHLELAKSCASESAKCIRSPRMNMRQSGHLHVKVSVVCGMVVMDEKPRCWPARAKDICTGFQHQTEGILRACYGLWSEGTSGATGCMKVFSVPAFCGEVGKHVRFRAFGNRPDRFDSDPHADSSSSLLKRESAYLGTLHWKKTASSCRLG